MGRSSLDNSENNKNDDLFCYSMPFDIITEFNSEMMYLPTNDVLIAVLQCIEQ